MKCLATTLCATIIAMSAFSQSSSTFLRSDTIVLQSSECNWLMPPGAGTSAKKLGEWFLQSIRNGKLIARDPETGQLIPASKIYTWGTSVDTVAVLDENGEISKYATMQAQIDPSKISQIRIQQDWYLDSRSGKIFPKTKWVQLMLEAETPSGLFIGFKPFCSIIY